MKFEFGENEYHGYLTLTPETPAEMAQVARLTKNAKAVKPDIYLSFSDDKPYCHISLSKISKQQQKNSMSNDRAR